MGDHPVLVEPTTPPPPPSPPSVHPNAYSVSLCG